MNCQEFAVSTNILVIYFIDLLNYYEYIRGNIKNSKSSCLDIMATRCYLDNGDHSFNKIKIFDPEKKKEYNFYIDSFYRSVKTENEFRKYLRNSKVVSRFINSFVYVNSKLFEVQMFKVLDLNSRAFIVYFLERIELENLINVIHNNYYHYFHHDKLIPQEAIAHKSIF
jgi:hypothetical protein